jgi:metal-sulfur cluster biosynthetic enzyme
MIMPTSASTPKESILKLLATIIDPETGINIVDMGLIYEVTPSDEGVFIKMGMTSAACPMGDLILEDMNRALHTIYVTPNKIDIEVTFNPPWEPSMMSESARKEFGW